VAKENSHSTHGEGCQKAKLATIPNSILIAFPVSTHRTLLLSSELVNNMNSTTCRLLCILLLLLPIGQSTAVGGIPEPGVVLYGSVSDAGTGNHIFIGTLYLVYSDPFGKTITNTVLLQSLKGGYSYVTEIPFESAVLGYSVGSNAFMLPANGAPAQTFSRAANYAYATGPASLQQGNADTISFSQKGKLLRLDLVVTAKDTNGLGLPDYWQVQYFGTIGINPQADPDHDGASNHQEYLAGTDPIDSSSVFEITSLRFKLLQTSAGATLSWKSVADKSYTVLSGTNLNHGFSVVGSNILATPPENVFIDTSASSQSGFYRVSTP
jgi:hypothetical protein